MRDARDSDAPERGVIMIMETMTSPNTIFDPRHYRNVRLPALEAETLPAWSYTAREFYDREVERIFRTEWNFIGRADEIAQRGDYRVFDLVGESIIVLRDREDRLRAFANTCRHRGTRLLDGAGNCKSIACPYHAWVYALDGSLISSLGMEETSGFDPAAFGLIPMRLEEWAGFLFINFAAEG
jgi:phenylpropionate dioxygenase-like ring-hydroxylating dioxygenase large terminal subunit